MSDTDPMYYGFQPTQYSTKMTNENTTSTSSFTPQRWKDTNMVTSINVYKVIDKPNVSIESQ